MTSQKEEIDEAFRQMENLAPGRTDVAKRCLNIVYQRYLKENNQKKWRII